MTPDNWSSTSNKCSRVSLGEYISIGEISKDSQDRLHNLVRNCIGIEARRRTDFGAGNKFTASGAGFIDPMNDLLDRIFQIEPALFSLDGCSFVFLDEVGHDDVSNVLRGSALIVIVDSL